MVMAIAWAMDSTITIAIAWALAGALVVALIWSFAGTVTGAVVRIMVWVIVVAESWLSVLLRLFNKFMIFSVAFAVVFPLALALFLSKIVADVVARAETKLYEHNYRDVQIFWILLLTANMGLAMGWVLYQRYPWYKLWGLGN